jgi:GTP pyrophosphokinase
MAGSVALKADLTEFLRSSAADPRLVMLRAAWRIAELDFPGSAPGEALARLARDALDVLVPLADRLGLGALRARLEDTSFRVLEPETYRAVSESVRRIRGADEACLELLVKTVRILLERHSVGAEICGRAKSIWSIYAKSRRLAVAPERILDRLGLRVVVQSVPDCYRVLGLLHAHFRPIPGTFDDYIGLPKENGYQSLHTCVYPVRHISAKPVELQIRTQAMHSEAEFGLAAHWLYKSQSEAETDNVRQRRWFRELESQHELATDHDTFLSELHRLVYERSVVVFLRGGKQVRLPHGATVREVLSRAAARAEVAGSVRVNAQVSPLDTELTDGDTVEWSESEWPSGGSSSGVDATNLSARHGLDDRGAP